MKKIAVLVMVLVLSIFMVLANEGETFTEAEKIIDSKIPCDQLTEAQ